MRITTQNYEAFLVDYYEGNLDAEHVAELLLFVEDHPELVDDMDVLSAAVVLEKENAFPYPNKDELMLIAALPDLKAETEELYFHQAVEKELNAAQLDELNNYLNKHPDKRKNLDLFQKSQLIPDLSIAFNFKEELYQSKVIPWQSYARYAGMAASILFLLLISNWWNTTDTVNVEAAVNSEILDRTNPRVTHHSQTGILHPLLQVKLQEVEVAVESKDQAVIYIEDKALASRHKTEKLSNTEEQIQEIQPIIADREKPEEMEMEVAMVADSMMQAVLQENKGLMPEKDSKLTQSTPKLNQFLLNKLGSKIHSADKKDESADYDANELALAIAENLMPGIDMQQDENGEVKTLSFKLGKFSVTRKSGSK